MRRLFTAAAAFMLACAMTAGMASCGDKEKSESSVSGNTLVGGQKPTNMSNEDYQKAYVAGADLLPSIDSNVTIQISYDNSFWNDETGYEELYLVDRYIDALNKADVKTIAECYYPGYLESVCEDNDKYANPEAFIKDYYSNLAEKLCEGFSINFIEVSNCQLAGDLDADSRFATRDETLKKAFGDDFTSKISDRKLLTIGNYTYFGNADNKYLTELTNVIPEGIQFCVYEIEGKPYIF